ncbi:MAG: hypothetical protein P1U57_04635 [Oleibacter sp.]|nr:hypothetical protein [Thalassolituus sp.]
MIPPMNFLPRQIVYQYYIQVNISLIIGMLVFLCTLLLSAPSFASLDYIQLRSGPGLAYPITLEVPSERPLRALERRLEWYLMTDERNQGWIKASELYKLDTLPRDELWKLINDTHTGSNSISFIAGTDSVFGAEYGRPWRNSDVWAMLLRSPSGNNDWSSFHLGLKQQFTEFTDVLSVNWLAGAGFVYEGSGSDKWSSDNDGLFPSISLGLEASWKIAPTFELATRINSLMAVDNGFNDFNQRTHLALVWTIKI